MDSPTGLAAALRRLAQDPEALTAAHRALENQLISMRDSRIFLGPHANGLVVKEADGRSSSVIRIGTRAAVEMALKALAEHIETKEN